MFREMDFEFGSVVWGKARIRVPTEMQQDLSFRDVSREDAWGILRSRFASGEEKREQPCPSQHDPPASKPKFEVH